MFLEKMTSQSVRLRPKYGIGQFCIHFMRILTRWLKPTASDMDGSNGQDNTPQWRYVVQYHLGDLYSGDYHDQSGVIVEGNYFRAQAAVTQLIQDQYPEARSIMIVEFERINKRSTRRKSKRAQPTGPGYLYLIEGKSGEYKIGLSAVPQQRISLLGVQLPFPIEVIHLIETDNMLAAERLLHERFAAQRLNGEWFALAASDVAYIQSLPRIEAQ